MRGAWRWAVMRKRVGGVKGASAKAVADAKAMLAAGHGRGICRSRNDILFSRAKVYSGDNGHVTSSATSLQALCG